MTASLPTLTANMQRLIEMLAQLHRIADGDVPSSDPAVLEEQIWLELAPEQVREAFDYVLMSKHAEEGLEWMVQTGLMQAWLPEAQAMVGFGDGEWRHKDVWKHTKQVVRQSVPRLAVRWAALLHDVGKVKTRSIGPKGEVHFFGHSEVGAAMFRKRIAKRIPYDKALFERVHFLIINHLRASQYDGTWTDSAVRRFAREMGDGLTDLFDLSRADITTKRPEKKKRGLGAISELSARVRELAKQDAKVPPLPKGLGTEITKHFGVPPSKRLGELRDLLEGLVNEGTLEGQQDCAYYIAWLDAHRARYTL